MNVRQASGMLLVLVAGAARAEVGQPNRPRTYITPGPTVEMGLLDGALRFGGELALTQYWSAGGAGAAFGFAGNRIYFEAQPVIAFNVAAHTVLVGINPGLAIDVAGRSPLYGGQLTLWANYAHATSWNDLWAWPLVPFVRVQLVPGAAMGLTGGVMLKLPWNAA